MLRQGKSLAIVAIAAIALACVDQDPFSLSERTVAGDYRLKRWEDDKTYYLVGGPQPENRRGFLGGAPINGTVVRIGWTADRILVDRFASFRGDPDGVMVIDVPRQTVTGPITERALAADPELAGIKLLSPEAAWTKLRWKPRWRPGA